MLKLFTFVPNRADLIDIQVRSFQKYSKEDFTLTVFNNALLGYDRRENHIRESANINETCRRLGIPVISIQKEADLISYCQSFESRIFDEAGFYCNGNVAHAYALNWAWKNFILQESGIICIIDFDMFLKTESKLTDFAQDADLSFIKQSKPGMNDRPYIWPGFVLMNLDRLPEKEKINWMCGQIDGVPVDVGGQTNQYLEAHPELKIRHLGMNNFPSDSDVNYQILHIGETDLLHYRAGSNWENKSVDFHRQKTEWIKKELGL